MSDFVEELKWRGMIHDIMPGTQEQLSKGMTSGYIGFDPTGPSLHIGSLATIMLLVHFQRCGHKPFVLIGGATGMVGDPSGKSEERNLLDEETLRYNQESIRKQLSHFLDFEQGENAAVMVNNYDWTKEVTFLDFMRDIGKHISVNYMMAKESVKKRLETGISFTEFTYQLLQGFDFYHLYEKHSVKLQMGGSDQWGNITTGTELIRRKASGEAFALTTPLIKKSDGSKFGKTESGNIWLDPELTSPYQFYQFWLNISDEDALNLIKIFTLRTREEISELVSLHEETPHLRYLQKAIAEDITKRVHSEEDYKMAVKASGILFGKSTYEDLTSIDERTFLSVFEGVPTFEVSRGTYSEVADISTLLTETASIFSSRGELRRLVQGGGLSINKEKISDTSVIPSFQPINDKYLLVQKGKKNYFLIKLI